MPRPTTTVQAVCLGDELQDVSDEERRNLRIEQELVKDEQADKWEIEIEASSGTQSQTTRRRRLKPDGSSIKSGGLGSSNMSFTSSRASTAGVHHYEDQLDYLNEPTGQLPQLELNLDRTRLRNPSGISESTGRTSRSRRYQSSNGTTEREGSLATSTGSGISNRKERLLRLAAERGVGVKPTAELDEMAQIEEGVEHPYVFNGNITQPNELIAGLCLADEMADELEVENLEEEFGVEFPVPPGMNGSADANLGPDMMAEMDLNGRSPYTRGKANTGLGRLIRRRRNSITSQASGSTTSAPSFSAVSATPEPWNPTSYPAINSDYPRVGNNAAFQNTNPSKERGTKRAAFKAFIKGVSTGSGDPSRAQLYKVPSRSQPLPPVKPNMELKPSPQPILLNSSRQPASRSESNLPDALQKTIPSALDMMFGKDGLALPGGQRAKPSPVVSTALQSPIESLGSRSTVSLSQFPCDLGALLDHLVHAGVGFIQKKDAQDDRVLGQPVLLLLTVRRVAFDPPRTPNAANTARGIVEAAHLHLFPFCKADEELDLPGNLNGKKSLSQRLRNKERKEHVRQKVDVDTELKTQQQGSPAVLTIGKLRLNFANMRSEQEWTLQIKTVAAELSSTNAENMTSERGSEITPVARPSGQTVLESNGVEAADAKILRRNSMHEPRPRPSASIAPPLNGIAPEGVSDGPLVGRFTSASGIPCDVNDDTRSQQRSERSARKLTVLQQARADMRAANRQVTPQVLAPLGQPVGNASRVRPTIVIPGNGSSAASKATLASTAVEAGRPSGLLPVDQGESESKTPSSLGITPPGGSVSPGVLHYIDPANGKTYEIPPAMLEAFLVGSKLVAGGGDVAGTGGQDDSLSTGSASPYAGYSDTTSLVTPASSMVIGREAAGGREGDRTRMDSSSSALPVSPMIMTPSTCITANNPNKDREDMGSMRTFGTWSSTEDSTADSAARAKRREQRGNLKERMRRMKMDHASSGGVLDIMAEAETADPWDEPEQMEVQPVVKREPVVRFA